ncbi:MAG TPA: hypothetical protein VEG08_08245 [Terriglobales bacterium]|nr:hypothetical protein [Terriglobales bacterium]
MSWGGHLFFVLLLLLLIAAPVGLIWAWSLTAGMRGRRKTSGEWISLAVLIATTGLAALYLGTCFVWWPLVRGDDWSAFARYRDFARIPGRALVGLSVIALLGRPKMIVPLLCATLGSLAWWLLPILMQ